jgi:poly(hydroxyalkanoate) depolymerase family esterase
LSSGTTLRVIAAALVLAAPLDAQGRRVEGDFLNEQGSRHYALWEPARLAPGMPLVVVLHGCLQDIADIARGTGFDARADEAGFLVLYPEQPEMVSPARCWRWFAPEHQARGAGEPALIAGLTSHVARQYHADSARIYITGFGAGGAMALNAAAAYPDIFSAAAVHSTVPYGWVENPMQAFILMRGGQPNDSMNPERVLAAQRTLTPRRPSPLLIVHGGRDETTIARNADRLALQWKLAIERVLGRALSLEHADTVVNGRTVKRGIVRDGQRMLIDQWTVDGLSHAWSGGSIRGTKTDTAGPRATDLALEFFGLRPK